MGILFSRHKVTAVASNGQVYDIGNGYGNLYRLNALEFASMSMVDRHDLPDMNV